MARYLGGLPLGPSGWTSAFVCTDLCDEDTVSTHNGCAWMSVEDFARSGGRRDHAELLQRLGNQWPCAASVAPPRTSRRSSRSRSFSLPSPRALSMERLAARSDVLRENLRHAGVPERAAEFRRERRAATSDTDRDRARPAARPSPKARPLAFRMSPIQLDSLFSPLQEFDFL